MSSRAGFICPNKAEWSNGHRVVCIEDTTTTTTTTTSTTTKSTTTTVAEKKVNLNTDCGVFMSQMAKAFKGVSISGDVTADCENNVCRPFCRNPEEKYTGPATLTCQVKGKKSKIIPGRAKLSCAEPRDTLCGNLAPSFGFAEGHLGSISCQKVGKQEICSVKCTDPALTASVPTISCRVVKRRLLFTPIKAPQIKCQEPPPTPCGHFDPKIRFAKGNQGSIGKCAKKGKNVVCPVSCQDPEKIPSTKEILCKAMKKKKFAFSPATVLITCKG